MKIKIFEGIVKDIYKKCVKGGYTPATINKTGNLILQKKIPRQDYYTGEVFEYINIKQRKITEKECLDILKYSEENKWDACYLDYWDDDSGFDLIDRDVNVIGALRGVLVGMKK